MDTIFTFIAEYWHLILFTIFILWILIVNYKTVLEFVAIAIMSQIFIWIIIPIGICVFLFYIIKGFFIKNKEDDYSY